MARPRLRLPRVGGGSSDPARPAGTRPRPAFGPVAGFLAGVAASTFTTSVAAGVAGFQASRTLEPVEFTLRVGLLVAAPCMGAILATLVLPRRGARRPVWAISAGAALGPLIVLRLDRLLSYGWLPALAGVAALIVWTAGSAAVIAAAGTGGPPGPGGRDRSRAPDEPAPEPPPAPPSREGDPPGAGAAFIPSPVAAGGPGPPWPAPGGHGRRSR